MLLAFLSFGLLEDQVVLEESRFSLPPVVAKPLDPSAADAASAVSLRILRLPKSFTILLRSNYFDFAANYCGTEAAS